MFEIINNSKEILLEENLTYKEITMLLGLSERQALNILNKEITNKTVYNLLAISYVTGKTVNELIELSEEEKKLLDVRIQLIKQLK